MRSVAIFASLQVIHWNPFAFVKKLRTFYDDGRTSAKPRMAIAATSAGLPDAAQATFPAMSRVYPYRWIAAVRPWRIAAKKSPKACNGPQRLTLRYVESPATAAGHKIVN